MDNIKKILIVRSCHLMQFSAICNSLKEKYPQADLTSLAQTNIKEELLAQAIVNQVITLEKEGSFSLFNVGRKTIKTIREKKYDLLVIPYNNHNGSGYLKVESIGVVGKTPYVLAWMTDGKTKEYSLSRWKLLYITKILRQVVDSILFLIIALILGMFFLILKIAGVGRFLTSEDRKITFITPQNYNYPSARVRCYDFAAVLERQGFKADILAYDNLLKIRGEQDPIPEEMSNSRKLGVNLIVFFKLLFANTSSVYYLQKIKYNAVAPYLVSLLKKNKIIIDLDDDEFTSPVFTFLNSRQFLKIIAKKKVVGVSASSYLQELMQEDIQNVHYIPTVVDLKKFQKPETKKPEDKIIFCWSGIVFGPPVLENVEYVFSCFKKLAQDFPQAVLKAAIRGPLMDLVHQSLKNNYSGLNIEIIDWLPIEKMNDFYNSSDVGLNPLIRDYPFTRCKSPTKLFEYMACSLPSITHDIGEAKTIIKNGENGFLVRDKQDFIAKMEILAQDKDLRERMGKAARKTVEEKYCLEAIADELVKIVE